jgi:hypothetical protein
MWLPNLLGSLLRHCEADEVSRSNLVRGMRLSHTFQVLAMTKSEVLDESSNYENLEPVSFSPSV